MDPAYSASVRAYANGKSLRSDWWACSGGGDLAQCPSESRKESAPRWRQCRGPTQGSDLDDARPIGHDGRTGQSRAAARHVVRLMENALGGSASSLTRRGVMYLPTGLSEPALAAFGRGHYARLLAELKSCGPYERVGVDRALAIAIDLALLPSAPGSRILDVGCSVGTISRVLAALGYQVLGIDSEVVSSAQPWQDPVHIARSRMDQTAPGCQFLQADIRDYLRTSDCRFDVVLLLSVLHHWLEGYGYAGAGRFTRQDMRQTLTSLCARVDRCLYVETPIEDEAEEIPADADGEFLFPGWFVRHGGAVGVAHVASTVATNGKPRRLYRIDL